MRCVVLKIKRRSSFKQDFDYDEKNKEGFIEKKDKKVFIFATIPFYDIGGGQRSSQFAKTFNKMGYEVFYIYGFKSSDKNQFKLENPCCLHKFVDEVSLDLISKYMDEKSLFIFEGPCVSFIPYLEHAKKIGAKVVYENIDNWEDKELGGLVFSEDTLKKMITDSDILTCTAKPLVEQTEKYLKKYGVSKEIVYVPNAVDDELFNARKKYEKPEDFVSGSKTLLYYGSLWGTWFDWDSVFSLAKSNPDISVNLIGDASGITSIVESAPINVHFLGLKKQGELPAYLAFSDFAILPFKVDNIGKYVSPLKIFEYIAMNKRVISTKLPDVKDYPNVTYVESVDDWQKALDSNVEVDTKEAESFTFANNWYNRIETILANVYPENSLKSSSNIFGNLSVVVLNYNNSNVIFRCVDTLIRHNKRYNYEIVVVDNQSTDGSYEDLMKNYDKKNNVKIVRNSKNGCSSGRNLGVQNAKNDYIIFLDSDQWVTNDYWLDDYFELIKMNPEKTVIGWGAGWFNKRMYAYHVVDSFPYRYLMPKYIATCNVGYLATCGFIIKKSFFNEIGGFDEAYDPTCYEDTDLSLAVRDAGGEIYYSKYLGVGHLPHQTTKSGTKAHEELIMKKGDYFKAKWCEKNKELITKYTK